ncbi:MAG: TRAP transporter small permease [Acetobacteraceae bacterium]|jgi:TRAP-type C4-dicarboxylate transport system permease small subunit
MLSTYRRAMDGLYWVCVMVAGGAMVLISVIVPWGVFTRYVLNSASSWPEPAAILLSIVLTFFGAAACYRVKLHMRVSFVRDLLPPLLQRASDLLAELLMAMVGVFMIVWGTRLCETTWYQSIDAFPALSVGVTYLPIPLGGFCLLLFVIERLLIGAPSDTPVDAHAAAPFD